MILWLSSSLNIFWYLIIHKLSVVVSSGKMLSTNSVMCPYSSGGSRVLEIGGVHNKTAVTTPMLDHHIFTILSGRGRAHFGCSRSASLQNGTSTGNVRYRHSFTELKCHRAARKEHLKPLLPWKFVIIVRGKNVSPWQLLYSNKCHVDCVTTLNCSSS